MAWAAALSAAVLTLAGIVTGSLALTCAGCVLLAAQYGTRRR